MPRAVSTRLQCVTIGERLLAHSSGLLGGPNGSGESHELNVGVRGERNCLHIFSPEIDDDFAAQQMFWCRWLGNSGSLWLGRVRIWGCSVLEMTEVC